jgi:tetratricopeptide (TPR) repeat protein
MLHQLSTSSPADLLRILDGIAAIQSDDRNDPFHDLGELQLEAALKLSEHRATLSAAEQVHLDECLARAYVATGQTRRGIDIYEKLLDRNPRDKPLLTAYAELLMKCGNKDCLNKALATWQKLEATCQAATAEWLAMRYEVCRTLVLLQETIEACKLLKVTRLLYPKIENEKWRQKFAELEAACTNDKGKKVKP